MIIKYLFIGCALTSLGSFMAIKYRKYFIHRDDGIFLGNDRIFFAGLWIVAIGILFIGSGFRWW